MLLAMPCTMIYAQQVRYASMHPCIQGRVCIHNKLQMCPYCQSSPLTVGVQEGEYVAGGHRGTKQPGGDQAFPFALAYHFNDVQLLQILVQLVLQPLYRHTSATDMSTEV